MPKTLMIDPETLAHWLEADEADLYDVREAHEFAAERIAGSVPVALSNFDPSLITREASAGETGASESGRRVVLHCRSGVRCGVAADLLRAAGFAGDIHRLAGGIIAWKASGKPVTPGT